MWRERARRRPPPPPQGPPQPQRPAPPFQPRTGAHAGVPGPDYGARPYGGFPGPPFPPFRWHLGRFRGRRGRGCLRRSREDRLLGGVAGGVSHWTGIDPTIVRLAFVVFGLASGIGVAVYVLVWLLVPFEGESQPIAVAALADPRGIALAATFVPALVATLVVGSKLGVGWLTSLAWPLFLGGAGIVLVWRNGSEEERGSLRNLVQPFLAVDVDDMRSRRALLLRVLVGGALVISGSAVLVIDRPDRSSLVLLGGVVLVVGSLVVVFGPWWLGLARDLVTERQARARAEERANMAARLHDSVLQTLALIQRRADQPQQVVQLARAQERELRSWLFDRNAAGSPGDPMWHEDRSLAVAIQRIERDVEALCGVPIEAVTVGDCELDQDLAALVDATREATVNAAKWSGASVISLFAEVESVDVSVFVRDRGNGFDPAAVAPDRKGLSESIHGRMARHGGSSTVRSAPETGTEVVLTMPLDHKLRRTLAS